MKKINLAITGCLGRMGLELVSQVKIDKRIKFVGGFDIKDKKNVSKNVFSKADVVIDFSSPSAIKNNLEMAIHNNTGLVIGTTGLEDKEFNKLNVASKKIPILVSPNMSLAVNLLFNLVQKTASILKDSKYDIEIAETHHKH